MKRKITISIDDAVCTVDVLRELADFIEEFSGELKSCEGDNYIADIVDEENENESKSIVDILKEYVYKFATDENRITVENGPSWTFIDDDNIGRTDTVTAVKVRENGKLILEWSGERGHYETEYDGNPDYDTEHSDEFNEELLSALEDEYVA